MKKSARRRIDVNLDELDRVLDGARQAPLSEADYEKVKDALHAMAAMPVRPRNTEKTSAVLDAEESGKAASQPDTNAAAPAGHGRNGAEAFGSAQKVEIAHQSLKHGDRCPECREGNVYEQKEPKVVVRIVGQAPLAATVYSLERLRCGACGQVFTAQAPEGVGPEKYDETAAAIIAQLKYGSGIPFYRLEQLEGQLGIPLPAATQWEIVEEAAELLKPARDELIRQAAQGEVVHNDDTSMRVLRLAREPSDERRGVFTSGIVSTSAGWKIALYFTGRQHAGENIADVLHQRAAELPSPIQMCDALSRNVPRLPTGVEILLANCLAHGRRQFIEVAANFLDECRYVLEMLGQVYGHDADARGRGLTPDERLRLHQERSGPVMDQLHRWLEAQFAERKTEPNSGLGKAITYLLRHWRPLTLFLRQAGAPLDNNIRRAGIEARGSASEKRAVLSDSERGAGRRPVYEPDSHLPVVRHQLLRLPDRAPAPRPGTGSQPRGVDAVELRRDNCARWNMMNADWPERPWIRVKDRKQITPDERVPLELSDHERELILKHTFADDDLTGRLRIVRRPGEPPVYRFTLDDLDELAGHVAAEANHAKDKKLEKQLHRLYARIAAVLESYTDETDGSTR